jgi:hypothetical protein
LVKRLKQVDLARALGISAAMVSKLKQRGMPVTSIEAAQRWRRENLDPALLKTMRDMSPPDPVAEVNRLGALALADFATNGEALREAILALPAAQKKRVELDVTVWDRLCVFASAPATEKPTPIAAPSPPKAANPVRIPRPRRRFVTDW